MRRLAPLLLLLATAASAQEGECLPGEVCLVLNVGDRWGPCGRGVLMCPALAPICDDPRVVIPEGHPEAGLVWTAVGEGETLCSASGPGYPAGPRTHFRITVR